MLVLEMLLRLQLSDVAQKAGEQPLFWSQKEAVTLQEAFFLQDAPCCLGDIF